PLFKDKKINFNFFTNQPNFTDHALAFKEWITKQLSASSNLPVHDSIRDLAPAEAARVEPDTHQFIESAREIRTEIEPSSPSFSNKHKKIGEELAKSTESSVRSDEAEPESGTLVSQEADLTTPNLPEVRQRLIELMEELDKLVVQDRDNLELADELFLLIDSNYHALGTEEANAKIVQLIEKYSQVTKYGLFYVRGALELLDGYAENLDRDTFKNLVINLINNYILSKESESSREITQLLLDQAPLLADNYEDLVIRLIELHISLTEYNLAWDAEYGMELLNIFKPSLNRDKYANLLIKSIENFSQTDSRLAINRQTEQELVEDTPEHMPHADKAEALLTTERDFLLRLELSPYNRLVINLVQNCSKLNDWESNIYNAKIARKVLLENKNQLPDSTYKQLVIGLLKNCVKKHNNYMYNEYIAQQMLDENQDWLTSETYNEAYKEYVTEFFINSINHKHLLSLLARHGNAISVEEISKKYASAKKEASSSNKKIIQAIETYTNQEGQSRQIRLEDLGETA
ncbi:MAG: FimV family protein, partial [Burkholderiales bacterium]